MHFNDLARGSSTMSSPACNHWPTGLSTWVGQSFDSFALSSDRQKTGQWTYKSSLQSSQKLSSLFAFEQEHKLQEGVSSWKSLMNRCLAHLQLLHPHISFPLFSTLVFQIFSTLLIPTLIFYARKFGGPWSSLKIIWIFHASKIRRTNLDCRKWLWLK